MLNNEERLFIWNLINIKKERTIKALDKVKNKTKIIEYSISNRIDSHLDYFIKKNNIEDKFPSKLLKNLNETVSYKNYRSLLIFQEILNISSLFKKNKINYVFLKGSANLNLNSKYLTPMRDIDILVAPQDISLAVKLISDAGFFRPDKSKYLYDRIPDNPNTYNLPLLMNEKDIFLEIHYKIISDDELPCRLSRYIFENKCIHDIGGESLSVPCNESMILHYLYHGISKGNFDVGPSAVLIINLLKKTRNYNDRKLFEIANLTKLHLEYKIFKALENFENEDKTIQKNLCNVFVMPVVNKKVISFKLEKSFLKKLKMLLDTIFVEKKLIMREFNILNFSYFHYFLYFNRWHRQAALLIRVVRDIVINKKDISKRASTILDLKNQLGLKK